jgi:hypothetical protein
MGIEFSRIVISLSLCKDLLLTAMLALFVRGSQPIKKPIAMKTKIKVKKLRSLVTK